MQVFPVIRIAALALGLASAAQAQEPTDRVIYAAQDWAVHIISLANAETYCVAAVELEDSSFSIWMNRDMTGLLRFQSMEWRLGSGSGDVVMQIDNLGKWSMDRAKFDDSIIWFVLYETDLSDKLIRHVAQGNRAKLYNKSGKLIESWPLAGSSASIDRLRACLATLPGGDDANPFD